MKARKNWKVVIAGVTAAILTMGIGAITAEAKAMPQIFDLEAHRGGRDARPENTLISFAYAMELGVTTLEMDMQLTKDGQIVISHNPFMTHNLAKDSNGKYVEDNVYDIRAMTLKQVKQFDVGVMNTASGDYYEGHGKTQISVPGTKLPTLEEVFELANSYGNDKIMFNIETKCYPDTAFKEAKNSPNPAVFVAEFYEIVKKYHMENRVMLQSFDWRTLKEMHKLDPNITLVALTCEQPSWGRDSMTRQVGEPGSSPWMAGLDIDTYKGDYVKAAKAIHADVVSPYWEELSNELVTEAHEMGMKVVPWTVDDAVKMNMLLDMGVDGIITDKPWILRDLLVKRGIEVANPTVNTANPYHTGTNIAIGATKTLGKGGDSAE